MGVPENPFFPTYDFNDFCRFKEDEVPLWKKFLALIIEKYKKLAALDKDKRSINTIFYNRLLKHGGNEFKGVLLFSGRWNNFLPLALARSLAASSKLSFSILNFAHPFTDASNVVELNPMLTSTMGDGAFSSNHFFEKSVWVKLLLMVKCTLISVITFTTLFCLR